MIASVRRSHALTAAGIGLLFLTVFLGGGCGSQHASAAPRSLPGAWFPYQQGWLGGDGAYSIPLGGDRSLWIFGDTLTGAATATSRKQATGFTHNSIAISTCPLRRDCTFRYYWAGMNTSKPKPVFSAKGSDWYWPMDGFVYHGTLYEALMQMHATGAGGASGFAYSGVQLASIKNYTAPPSRWSVSYQKLNTGGTAIPGVSIVVREGPDGNPDPSNPHGANYAYFFSLVGNKRISKHLALLRLLLSELARAARPGNAPWEYLTSGATWRPWPKDDTALPSDNAAVLKPGASEMTIRYHRFTNQWIAVFPVGMAKAAYYCISPPIKGPGGPPEKLYAYPEMKSPNPNYTRHVFCYVAREHIELEAPGQIFFTYACNSTQEKEIIDNMNLYHPVVVTRPLPHR